MNRTSTWNNVPCQVEIDLFVDDDGVLRDNNDREAPQFLKKYLTEDGVFLLVNCLSSGYHTPASMYGGSQGVGWPEEGDEECKVISVVVNNNKLSENEQRIVEEHFWKEIEG